MIINVSINGCEKSFNIQDHEMLIDVLRNNGYLSVKKSCDTSSCGICTVHVDDKPILSCSYLAARVHGKKITTVEGLQREVRELASFIVEEGAEQCGFCSPSLAMTVLAMKKELKNPTEEDIRNYLVGNTCRCSGFQGHMRAIKKYMGVK